MESSILRIADRLGVPVLVILAFVWLTQAAIKGPGMIIAAQAGAGFSSLCRAGVDYLAKLTTSLEGNHQAMKAHVSAEASSVREHVTDEIKALRDRVSTSEDKLEGAIERTRSGSQPVLSGQCSPTPASGFAPVTPLR